MGNQNSYLLYSDAGDADGICASQTPAAGGVQALTIAGALASGGAATIGTDYIGRQVALASDGDDSGRIFTITGTDNNANTITEKMVGPNATTVVSNKYFKTVTAVSVDADTAGAITVGTNAVAVTRWFFIDSYGSTDVSIACSLRGDVVIGSDGYDYECITDHTGAAAKYPAGGATWEPYWRKLSSKGQGAAWASGTSYTATGAMTYTVKYTLDNIQTKGSGGFPFEFDSDDSDVVTATASATSNFAYPPKAVRVHLSAFTSGSLLIQVIQ